LTHLLTGYRTSPSAEKQAAGFFPHDDALSFQKGSACAALKTVPAFDEYVFIERSPEYLTFR
jgi:hypothetical protein